MTEAARQSHQPRKRWGGRTGVRVRAHVARAAGQRLPTRKKYAVIGRSHASSTVPARAGFECGQDRPYGSKHIPGQFKVQLPPGRIRYVRP